MLEVDHLSVRYGAVRAVHGLSLRAEAGEIVALLGANGAGKTSTLMAIAGAVPIDDGDIRLHGESVVGLAPERIARRGVALVPEGRRIFSGLTVEENLRLAASWRKDRDAVEADIGELTERFSILSERFRAPAGAMSGGEQQQLAIARALMLRPSVLLLDEPSLGLAPRLVREIMTMVDGLRAEGRAILLVEQNAHEAMAVADRVYVLETGLLRATGAPEELRGSTLIERAYLGERA